VSIVEKALSKARTEDRTPPRTEARVTPLPAAEHVEAAPRRSITLDLENLRAGGLSPAADFLARVRHEYRRIKWPVLDAALRRSAVQIERGNLIMVTSALPGEGKSFTSMNLALALAAEHGCTVLLFDTDFAKPKLSRVLGLAGEPGLYDLLSDSSLTLPDVTIGTDTPGLRIVPAGRSDSTHAKGPELLGGRRMEQLCADLAARPLGTIAVFDSSPLLATNEGQVLSRLVGQTLLVVKSGATPKSAVKEAVALVNRTTSVGLVLNQHQMIFGSAHYGDYYDYENK
jgi:protein-tyrosine kinase